MDIINDSSQGNKHSKKAIIEGSYTITISLKNGTTNIFEVGGVPNFYWKNEDMVLSNPELIFFIRELLFDELIKNNIKLQ